MVASSHIDLHALTLDELTGVVNLYPWYGAAHVELSRRMNKLGGAGWGEEQYARESLYVADRSILSRMVRSTRQADYSDKDLQALLSAFLTPEASETPEHQVRVVGGDYFSQAQYDHVKEAGDNIFSRFAGKAPSAPDGTPADYSDIAERYPTETLARIFAEQGCTDEAVRIYSRLVLDIPEKSAYFASLIEKLKD